MKELRSASQILFGFLPDQTADLKGRVWIVTDWETPTVEPVEPTVLRNELLRQLAPWSVAKRDGGYARDLYQGRRVHVLSLSRDNGVRVTQFPRVWMCKRESCHRIVGSETTKCKCGYEHFGQLPFVGYHDACGAIREPWIPECPQHREVKVVWPGTSSAAEIRFVCPTCNRLVRKGFGFPKCACGKGTLSFNVHRAASVYTPRTMVVVNPPTTKRTKQLTEAGGAARALSWVIDGMTTASIEDVPLSPESLLRDLIEKGIAEAVARSMVEQAVAGGGLEPATAAIELPADRREEAEREAVTIALAVSQSRTRVGDLLGAATAGSALATLYRDAYPRALARAGLEGVELIEKFPVLTANFGYTRGASSAGASRLVPFRDRRGEYVVYGEVADTESLFVRLDPVRVAQWLARRGHSLTPWSDASGARRAVLSAARIPLPGDEPAGPSVGSDVLTLVHSYAHRLVRHAAIFAGVDRNALSELLVPAHLGFFVYAAARGSFVLGGLQAVFESELDRLLAEFVGGDHRCPLDPGCQRAGGACMACLHLGEPSCRYYNRFLDRGTLFGVSGIMSQIGEAA